VIICFPHGSSPHDLGFLKSVSVVHWGICFRALWCRHSLTSWMN
jgi:hypothetical protein